MSYIKHRADESLEDYLETILLLQERHTILADLLIRIGVNEETAREDACRVEHDLSEESFEAIKRAFHSSQFSSDNS
ncbi:MAG: iron dependent repressor, metal binding and dimerization domain protein [Lachnospiraceae bacterium]